MILSVVVPTCNKSELLAQTLAALASQELAEPWEIVVVNDGSSDGTADLLEDFSSRGLANLRYLNLDRNRGRAVARNLGIQKARGRWVLFLDDDIVAPDGLLAAHLRRLVEVPGCGTIGLVQTDPALVDNLHFQYMDTRGIAKVKTDRVPPHYFVTQNAAVLRQALQAVGGFDETFSAYGFEDCELAFRLENTCQTVFLPLREPVPRHVHHHSLDQYLDKKRECGRYSLPRLAELHPDRLLEMNMHWAVDSPDGPQQPWRVRAFRILLSEPMARGLTSLVRRWPTRRQNQPWASGLFYRLLDGLVLCQYRLGVLDRKTNLPNRP